MSLSLSLPAFIAEMLGAPVFMIFAVYIYHVHMSLLCVLTTVAIANERSGQMIVCPRLVGIVQTFRLPLVATPLASACLLFSAGVSIGVFPSCSGVPVVLAIPSFIWETWVCFVHTSCPTPFDQPRATQLSGNSSSLSSESLATSMLLVLPEDVPGVFASRACPHLDCCSLVIHQTFSLFLERYLCT